MIQLTQVGPGADLTKFGRRRVGSRIRTRFWVWCAGQHAGLHRRELVRGVSLGSGSKARVSKANMKAPKGSSLNVKLDLEARYEARV